MLVSPPFGPDRNIATTIGSITIKFGTHIHVPLMMSRSSFGDRLIFLLCDNCIFGLWPSVCKTNDILISLAALCVQC